MFKKIKMIVMILIVFLIMTFMTNISQARVTSTDVTVESGGTASITISTSTPVRSFKIELISAGGLTFQTANKSSSFPAGASNGSTINGVSQGDAATTLATYTFKVPEVTTSQSYTVQFRVTGMDKEEDTTNTATVTVNPKQEEPTPEPEPEPTPDPTPEQTPEEPTKPTYTVSEASGTFYVTASSVFVREGPGTNYERVGSLTKDAEVTRTGVSGSWTRISYNGREAFISSEYLTSTKPVEEEPEENENENENTIANEVANEMTNETTNETTNQEKVNEITGTTVDGEQAIDENSELQLKTLAIEGVDTSSIFKPGIYEYNINVSKDVKQLEITAVANQKDASVEILGNEDFVEGENIVTIMLKSADGEETATYQLIVNVGAATAEEGFPFVAVLGIIAGIIVVAIIVLIVLMVRNRRNAQWDEDEEDWEEPEELNTTYNTPDFTNQEDDDEEEFSTKNKRGKHF